MTLKWSNEFTGEKGYFKNGIRDEKHRVTYRKQKSVKGDIK